MPRWVETASSDDGWRTNASIVCGMTVPVALLAVLSWLAPAGGTASPSQGRPVEVPVGALRRLQAQVVASYPHDPQAFTQGLVLDGGVLYESTGLNGRSTLRRVEIQTGRVLETVALPQEHFGEGLARIPGALVQLTWTSGVALVYDQQTLALRRRMPYQGEGWGLCYDGRSLVMSDGSDRLAWRHPETFAIERTLQVTFNGAGVRGLNELECVDGTVYANVWQRESIARVDPATGRILERIDASNLLSPSERAGADVLNGIAYDPADGLFYLTGKLWPRLFKVRFVPAAPGS